MIRSLSLFGISLTLVACSSPNPAKVWLALNGSERAVQLVPYQPEPF